MWSESTRKPPRSLPDDLCDSSIIDFTVGVRRCAARLSLAIYVAHHIIVLFFACTSGKMAVARQGDWATTGAAERMKMETKELDDLMRGADGVQGDVRDALYEAVGVRATQCAQ
jgi:hypothetical protein